VLGVEPEQHVRIETQSETVPRVQRLSEADVVRLVGAEIEQRAAPDVLEVAPRQLLDVGARAEIAERERVFRPAQHFQIVQEGRRE
jgi:hypothetical protein